jgi:hypothetical protein
MSIGGHNSWNDEISTISGPRQRFGTTKETMKDGLCGTTFSSPTREQCIRICLGQLDILFPRTVSERLSDFHSLSVGSKHSYRRLESHCNNTEGEHVAERTDGTIAA